MTETKGSALETGEVFEGRSVGATGEKGGDLVFNTAMSGYQGSSPIPDSRGHDLPAHRELRHRREDSESERAWAEAFVIRELSSIPSNHRADLSSPSG